jgi:tetratricopeptide (TPR) repeat protein
LLPLAKRGERSPDVITAYGLAAMRMAVLPDRIPPAKRPLVDLAGEAAWAVCSSHAEDAAGLYKQLVTAYPGEPGVHYAYAVYLLDKDPAGALAEFQKELEISPRHAYARFQIAFLDLKRGEPAAALQQAREALAIEPANFLGHNAIGRALLDLGKIDEALPELEQAVKLAPDVPQTHLFLEKGYRLAGRTADARREHAEFSRLLLLENPLISPLATPMVDQR